LSRSCPGMGFRGGAFPRLNVFSSCLKPFPMSAASSLFSDSCLYSLIRRFSWKGHPWIGTPRFLLTKVVCLESVQRFSRRPGECSECTPFVSPFCIPRFLFPPWLFLDTLRTILRRFDSTPLSVTTDLQSLTLFQTFFSPSRAYVNALLRVAAKGARQFLFLYVQSSPM